MYIILSLILIIIIEYTYSKFIIGLISKTYIGIIDETSSELTLLAIIRLNINKKVTSCAINRLKIVSNRKKEVIKLIDKSDYNSIMEIPNQYSDMLTDVIINSKFKNKHKNDRS